MKITIRMEESCCRRRKPKLLIQVPAEVLAEKIFSYLIYFEINRMQLVCKDFKRIITTYEEGCILRQILKDKRKNELKKILTGMDSQEYNQGKSICDRAKRLKKIFDEGNKIKCSINGQDLKIFAEVNKFKKFIREQILDLLKQTINIKKVNYRRKDKTYRAKFLQEWLKYCKNKNKKKFERPKNCFNKKKKINNYPKLYTQAVIDYKSIFLICAKCSPHLFMRLLQNKVINSYYSKYPNLVVDLRNFIDKPYIEDELKSKVKSFPDNLTTTAKLRNLL